jgi:hypothetical protein
MGRIHGHTFANKLLGGLRLWQHEASQEARPTKLYPYKPGHMAAAFDGIRTLNHPGISGDCCLCARFTGAAAEALEWQLDADMHRIQVRWLDGRAVWCVLCTTLGTLGAFQRGPRCAEVSLYGGLQGLHRYIAFN